MRIVRLLLEADDAVSADVFLKRAALIIHLVPPTPPASGAPPDYNADEAKVLHLHFKLCQARIYDAGRRFPEAAIRYHELSYVAEIDEEERTHML